MQLDETFEVHETLNPKIFDGNHLKREMHTGIINIVKEFEKYLKVPLSIADIQLCGSNCSYNYTNNSDLDVHIIANFEVVTTDTEILQALYDAKKSNFNHDYNITLHGIKVELYVQDIRSTCISNGIYSVCDDKWVREPKPIKSITKHNTEKDVEKWAGIITQAITECNTEQLNTLVNNLYLMRHNSIATEGEYGKGNQIFKDIRTTGLFDKLKQALKDSISKELSFESWSTGETLFRLED